LILSLVQLPLESRLAAMDAERAATGDQGSSQWTHVGQRFHEQHNPARARSFSRAIPLPFDPNPAQVEAKFDKGVLRIHLPKPAEVAQKQQKIEIKKA
jgi:hypothetical protein